jgi:hypothetical protein
MTASEGSKATVISTVSSTYTLTRPFICRALIAVFKINIAEFHPSSAIIHVAKAAHTTTIIIPGAAGLNAIAATANQIPQIAIPVPIVISFLQLWYFWCKV